MIVARDVELRAGARLLLEGATFQIAPGHGSAWSAGTARARPP